MALVDLSRNFKKKQNLKFKDLLAIQVAECYTGEFDSIPTFLMVPGKLYKPLKLLTLQTATD